MMVDILVSSNLSLLGEYALKSGKRREKMGGMVDNIKTVG